jgi:hypothetical protein
MRPVISHHFGKSRTHFRDLQLQSAITDSKSTFDSALSDIDACSSTMTTETPRLDEVDPQSRSATCGTAQPQDEVEESKPWHTTAQQRPFGTSNQED